MHEWESRNREEYKLFCFLIFFSYIEWQVLVVLIGLITMEEELDIEAESNAEVHLETTAIFKKANQPVILKVYEYCFSSISLDKLGN